MMRPYAARYSPTTSQLTSPFFPSCRYVPRITERWSATDAGASISYEGSATITEFAPGSTLTLELAATDGPSKASLVTFSTAETRGATNLSLTQTGFARDDDGQREKDRYLRGYLAASYSF